MKRPRKRFQFHRPVADQTRDQIFDTTSVLLKAADFINAVSAEELHLTLLNEKMISCQQPALNTAYSHFENTHRRFLGDVVPWKPAEISYINSCGVYGYLVIETNRPTWLGRERNTVIDISRAHLNKLTYSPHITLGKFIGTQEDWSGFYDLEKKLTEQLAGAFAVRNSIQLKPLELKKGAENWVFKPRQFA